MTGEMMPDKPNKGENNKTTELSTETADNRILRDRIIALTQSLEACQKKVFGHEKTLQSEIVRHQMTEESLRVSQRQLSQAMELAGIVFWEIDVEPEILFCNDAFYAFYGTTAEQEGGYAIPVEQYAKKFVHPDDLQRFLKNKDVIDATRKREFSADIEHRITRVNGEVRNIQALVRVLKDPDGHTTRIYGAHQDITERKRMEEALRSLNNELEQKVKERTKQLLKAQGELVRKEKLAILGQLAGIVGHEIRNPLGVMSNAVYFLKNILPGENDDIQEYLNIIQHGIGNCLKIITDLLDFSRTKPPKKSLVPIDAWVHQSLEKCNIPKSVTAKVDVPEGMPLVDIDLFQMIQVLQNLITNAVQAMPDGGILRISSGVDGLREAQRGLSGGYLRQGIKIRVRDTGSGISPENMEKLFQPLFTTKPKGIGLGLVVCKNLVEANGGEISVESRLQEGTTFIISLPIPREKG